MQYLRGILGNNAMDRIWVSLTLWFWCSASSVDAKQCNYYSECSCIFDDGSGMVDLSSMTGSGELPQFYDVPAVVGSYYYSYNPCGAFTEGTCTGVAVCQYDPVNYIYYDVGNAKKVSFSMDSGNVLATYSSADDSRKSYVTLKCDPAQTTPTMSALGEIGVMFYYMTVTAASICPVPAPKEYGGSGGLSGGSVLLIVFFVLLTVYLVVGVTFNKVRSQANGLEAIPNLGFWSSLPGLVMVLSICILLIGHFLYDF